MIKTQMSLSCFSRSILGVLPLSDTESVLFLLSSLGVRLGDVKSAEQLAQAVDWNKKNSIPGSFDSSIVHKGAGKK
jgi:hypothetical protein